MNIIETTAPISIDHLKKYFVNKDIFFVIDYATSELKGQKLLTYISNLDLPVDVVNFDDEFVKDYFYSPTIVNLTSLEYKAIQILFEYKNILDTNENTDFISSNKEILETWKRKLDSLSLYNMYTINTEEFKDYAKSFPHDANESLDGINFVSLLKHEIFFEWFANINEEELAFYTSYFDNYMFKGKNLYSYWAHENNPMFLLTWGISSGTIDPTTRSIASEVIIEEN